MRPSLRTTPALILTSAALGLAACGDDADRIGGGSSQSEAGAEATGDPGLQHIHGLGVQGKTLFIATHSGLFTSADGETKPRRFGESRQDVMGFSVIDEQHFIGSGHPAPGQSAPPNLGLIESRDGGKTWTTVSLDGEADFHTLESAGSRVYGFDGTQGRLMVSSDAGKTWDERTPPAGVFSLAIDPRTRDSIVASTERGLFASRDSGESFRPLQLREQLAGLLAWPTPDALYLVDGNGQVLVSANGGTDWQPVGSIDGQPAAFIAHGSELYAALADGTVKRSTDGGRTWTVRATP